MKKQISVLSTVCIFLFSGCSMDTLILKKSDFIVEYGEEIDKDPAVYLNTDDTDIIKNANIDMTAENEKDKSYPAVGEYTVTISYKRKKKDFKVIVKDTKKPEFINFVEEIVIEEQTEDVNWEQYFNVTDLSEFKINFNKDNVNLSKAGSYILKISAIDKYNNKAEKTTKVIVVTPEQVNNGKTLTTTTEGNTTVSPAKKQAEVKENVPKEVNKTDPKVFDSPSNSDTHANANQNPSNGLNNTSSNQGGTTNNGNNNVQEPPINIGPEPTCRIDYIGNSGKVWYPGQEEEAYAWADQYLLDHINEVWGWSGVDCGPCGLSGPFTIDFKYN